MVLLLRAEATPTTTILSVIIDPQEYVANRNILSYQLLIMSQLGKRAVQAVVVLHAEVTPTTTNEGKNIKGLGLGQ